MSQAYIRFVNSLHPQGKQLIPFTPELGYTITNVWGPTTVNAQIIFYPEAVEKLIRLTDAQFWSAMASALGTDARGVHSLMAKYDAYIEAKRNKSPVVNYRQIRERIGISYDEVKMISAAKTFLRAIAKAKRTDQQDKLKLVRRLADAMHKANISANGFFDPVIFRALIDYVGLDSVYSRSVIGAARGSFIEGQNLRGTFGKERPEKMKYLNYLPDTPAGLYDIFADL